VSRQSGQLVWKFSLAKSKYTPRSLSAQLNCASLSPLLDWDRMLPDPPARRRPRQNEEQPLQNPRRRELLATNGFLGGKLSCCSFRSCPLVFVPVAVRLAVRPVSRRHCIRVKLWWSCGQCSSSGSPAGDAFVCFGLIVMAESSFSSALRRCTALVLNLWNNE